MGKMIHKLTDKVIRFAQPGAKLYKLGDGNSLYLMVSPTGAKWWRYDYRSGGRHRPGHCRASGGWRDKLESHCGLAQREGDRDSAG
jgi:hypothetical protein